MLQSEQEIWLTDVFYNQKKVNYFQDNADTFTIIKARKNIVELEGVKDFFVTIMYQKYLKIIIDLIIKLALKSYLSKQIE